MKMNSPILRGFNFLSIDENIMPQNPENMKINSLKEVAATFERLDTNNKFK